MNIESSRTFAGVLVFMGAVMAAPLSAQPTAAPTEILAPATPQFFIAVVGGVILAIGFQLLLTSISLASGISLVGNVEEKADEAREHKRREEQSRRDKFEHDEHRFKEERKVGVHSPTEPDSHEQAVRAESRRDETQRQQRAADAEDHESTPVMIKISRAAGIWTIITVSISLFFASLLAVRLSLVGTVWIGITLGLIIWAAFFAMIVYLEVRSVATLTSGVFGAALNSMRASFSAAKSAFSTSPEDKIVHAATDLAGNLRQELADGLNSGQIVDKLDEYVERLKPQPIDHDRVKEDLTHLLRGLHLEEHADLQEGRLDRETFIRLAQDQRHLKKEDVQKLSSMYDEVTEALKQENSGTGKMEAVAEKVTQKDRFDVHQYRRKIEQYLRETGRDELDPERIEADINRMFEDPKATPEILRDRLGAIDRNTIVGVLSQRDDITEEKAEKIVANVERAIDFVREKAASMRDTVDESGRRVQGKASAVKEAVGAMPARAEARVRQYLASLGRPEFNYDRLRLDFERMFHDPKAAPKILRARMKLYDRDSLKALLASRKNMSEEDAERLVSKIEEARDNVIHKAEQVDSEVRHYVEWARRTALHEAETVRKASATAAWWMVGAAGASAVFSALGGVIAIIWW